MQVAIAVFPQLTALDAIGPYEVLQRVPSIDARHPSKVGPAVMERIAEYRLVRS